MTHWREFLDPHAPPADYLPWKVVAKRTSLSRTTAWRMQRRDDFPRPYAISPGRVGYREDEVDAWRVSRDVSRARARTSGRSKDVAAAPETAGASPPGTPATSRGPGLAPMAQGVTMPATVDRPVTRRATPSRGRSEHARAIAQQILFDF